MMKMEDMKKLIKIPLQFFGEGGGDLDDGFDDEFDDEFDDGYGYEDGDADGEDGDSGNEGGDADGEDGDAGEGGGEGEGSADNGKAKDPDHSDLIADLKALGFVGDDLEAIKADAKAKREAKERGDAASERKAAQAAGKSHIKGSKPQKGAGGDGTGGVTERRVIGFAEKTGCTREEARKTLSKHARMIQGG